ncbi:MAG: lamin tail domain-containing protein, partial [Fibromonadales bacterium]|nr:lamin tail domain-containing protein [Fibromonadales bacterium]
MMIGCKHPVNLLILLILVQALSCSNSNNSSNANNEDNNEDNKPVFVGNPPVMLSEIYTVNTDYKDEFSDNPGWVEFYNPADIAVNLKGYSLTNDANRILWTFGDAVVQPRSYLTVFFSGRDKPSLSLPSDSIDLIASAIGAWTWADSQREPPDPPGGSTAEHSFSQNTGLSGT